MSNKDDEHRPRLTALFFQSMKVLKIPISERYKRDYLPDMDHPGFRYDQSEVIRQIAYEAVQMEKELFAANTRAIRIRRLVTDAMLEGVEDQFTGNIVKIRKTFDDFE